MSTDTEIAQAANDWVETRLTGNSVNDAFAREMETAFGDAECDIADAGTQLGPTISRAAGGLEEMCRLAEGFAAACLRCAADLKHSAALRVNQAAVGMDMQRRAGEMEQESASWRLLAFMELGVIDHGSGSGDETFHTQPHQPVDFASVLGRAVGGKGSWRLIRQEVAEMLETNSEVYGAWSAALERCARIVSWLEATAGERLALEEGTQLRDAVWRWTRAQRPVDRTTASEFRALEEAEGRGLVKELDPDAPSREGRAIAGEDARNEAAMLRVVLERMMAGRWDQAMTALGECRQPWRAAAMQGCLVTLGGAAFHLARMCNSQDAETVAQLSEELFAEIESSLSAASSPSYQSRDGKSIGLGQHFLRRWAFHQAAAAASSTGGDLGALEAAFFGTLAGCMQYVHPVCTSWEGAAWSTFRCWLELAVDQALVTGQDTLVDIMVQRPARIAGSLEEQATAAACTEGSWPPQDAFEGLPHFDAQPQDVVRRLLDKVASIAGRRDDMFGEYRELQSTLMLDGTLDLISGLAEDNTQQPEWLLRFGAHAAVVLCGTRYASDGDLDLQVLERLRDTLLRRWLLHLRSQGEASLDLLPIYARHLNYSASGDTRRPGDDAREFYRNLFLHVELSADEERRLFLRGCHWVGHERIQGAVRDALLTTQAAPEVDHPGYPRPKMCYGDRPPAYYGVFTPAQRVKALSWGAYTSPAFRRTHLLPETVQTLRLLAMTRSRHAHRAYLAGREREIAMTLSQLRQDSDDLFRDDDQAGVRETLSEFLDWDKFFLLQGDYHALLDLLNGRQDESSVLAAHASRAREFVNGVCERLQSLVWPTRWSDPMAITASPGPLPAPVSSDEAVDVLIGPTSLACGQQGWTEDEARDAALELKRFAIELGASFLTRLPARSAVAVHESGGSGAQTDSVFAVQTEHVPLLSDRSQWVVRMRARVIEGQGQSVGLSADERRLALAYATAGATRLCPPASGEARRGEPAVEGHLSILCAMDGSADLRPGPVQRDLAWCFAVPQLVVQASHVRAIFKDVASRGGSESSPGHQQGQGPQDMLSPVRSSAARNETFGIGVLDVLLPTEASFVLRSEAAVLQHGMVATGASLRIGQPTP
ncbi:unnamed protein product [Pedinophyceae sp. YPF-701]|nr:unnamed protein product [Pedinophyceae sp. YPF-701]